MRFWFVNPFGIIVVVDVQLISTQQKVLASSDLKINGISDPLQNKPLRTSSAQPGYHII